MLRRRKGAAAIEFAFCLAAFTFLLLGVVDWGWMFYQRANLIDAVLVACREGVTVHQSKAVGPAATAEGLVDSVLRDYGMDPDTATISAEVQGVSPSQILVVEVEMPYDPPIGLLPVPTQLRAAMSMYMEMQ